MIVNSRSSGESSKKGLNSPHHVADIVSVEWLSKERIDVPKTRVMMAKEIIREEYEIGKWLGRNLQEILNPIELLVQKDTFGLGFWPTTKDKREMQTRKKAKKEGK